MMGEKQNRPVFMPGGGTMNKKIQDVLMLH